eukprot:gb/GFBE01000382.1/.p1 GENE.gb/GFBE01000382.1/~~gb/GFBE01000382.1/.p1  ORF type:complete len:135 (+),score=40.03 gb/GFBE01000382.1/:1-405(+)
MNSSLLFAVLAALSLQTAATAVAKGGGGGRLAAVNSKQDIVSGLMDLPADDLLEEDAEEPASLGGADAAACDKAVDENRQLATKLVKLERLGAEQDSALARLKSAVKELRRLAAADAGEESCAAAAPRCDHCPA